MERRVKKMIKVEEIKQKKRKVFRNKVKAAMINKKEKLYELGGTLPDQHGKWDKKKAAEQSGNAH